MLKRMIAGAGFLVLTALAVQAQDKGKAENYLGGTPAELQKLLKFDDEKLAEIQKVFDEFTEKLKDLDRKQLRDEITKARRAVRETLDKKAQRTYEYHLRKKGRNGRKGRGGMFNMKELAEKLGLDKEQTEEISQIARDLRTDVQQTSQEMKKDGSSREDIRKEILEVIKEYMSVIKEKLTEEQQVKFDAIMEEQKNKRMRGRKNGKQNKRNQGKKRGPNIDAVIKKMGLGDEEAATLKAGVKEMNELRMETGKWNREQMKILRKKLQAGIEEEELAKFMETLQAERKERFGKIRDLKTRVLDPLTDVQKAWLEAYGIR